MPHSLLGRLLPLFALVLLAWILGLWLLIGWMQEQRLREIVLQDMTEVGRTLDRVLTEQGDWLAALIEPIAADAPTLEALARADREALLARWQGLFERLGARNGLSHFYFIGPDRRTLLRIHNPEKQGDLLDRHTLRAAERDGQIAQGLELGPLGTLTLRVVKPIDVAGERIGYIELGKEIEDVLAMLHEPPGIELAVLLEKSRLERAGWENGMRLFGREPEWGRFEHLALVESSLDQLPSAFDAFIAQGAETASDRLNVSRDITFNGQPWRASLAPLRDVAGERAGCLLILRDLSREIASFERQQGAVAAAMLLLLLGSLALSAWLLARADHLVARSLAEQRAAQRSMSALKAVIDHSDAIVVVKDLDLRVIAANPAFAQASGHASLEELIGKTDAEIFGRDPREEPVRTYMADERRAQSLPPGEAILREEPVCLPSGEARTFLTKKYPIFDATGALIATGNISVDISLRKHTEERLIKANEALAEAMAQSQDLARRAEQASQAKSFFLSNMSHEIRTPLNGVLGLLELLEHTRLDAEQRGYVEIARASGESLLRIVNDILDFSKIEAGKLEVEQIDFDLCDLLDGVAQGLALQAHAKGLECLCAAAPEVPSRLRGDPGRIAQVLTNLAGNAVKFTASGEVQVWVTAMEIGQRQVRLRFSVRDTGPGIPEDKRGHLFESFSQLDPSHSRHFGGTGLGLAISRQLVELMGGAIGVDSQPGEGSTFWFELTLEPQEEPRAETPPVLVPGHRVLVVDDNASNREMLGARLGHWGLEVRAAASAAEALALLRRAVDAGEPPHCVLIDRHMPGMDGLALAAAIRAEPLLAGLPLVLMRPLGEHLDPAASTNRLFAAQLRKPLRLRDLRDLLPRLLESGAERRPPPPPLARPASSHAVALEPGLRASDARILLADDNRTNQLVALGQLRHLGYTADCADHGQAVLDALAAGHYDLLLLDIQMPGMDGFETLARIRASDSPARNPRLPVVAMTAHALTGDRERCLEAGMDDYLAKPLAPEALAAVLARWLPAARAEPGAPILDEERLLEQCMGDAALARNALEVFLQDLPNQLHALREALSSTHLKEIAEQAHQLKGAAASIAAVALAEAAHALETACHESPAESAHPEALLSPIERASQALQHHLSSSRLFQQAPHAQP